MEFLYFSQEPSGVIPYIIWIRFLLNYSIYPSGKVRIFLPVQFEDLVVLYNPSPVQESQEEAVS